MEKEVFSANTKLKEAVDVLNQLESSKFPLLLARISQKLHVKDEKAFTPSEEEKLQTTFQIDADALDLVIGTCEFFFQQAAYHSLKPKILYENLTKLHLSEEKATSISETWATCAKDVISSLKKQSINPSKMEGLSWKLCLIMAQSKQAKLKQPSAQVQFKIHNETTGEKDRLSMEFSHQELYQFYNQLEAIQSQLDSLS